MDELRQYATKFGRAAAHTLFPNEFEYYAVTLELTNSIGTTQEFLTFPVSPNNITYDDQTLVNIKKTFGGISATDSGTNRPKRITLTGSFGRKLRLLTGLNNHLGGTADGAYKSQIGEGLQIKTKILNVSLKTGYGTTKILKSIVEKSAGIDEFDKPMNLYLYFPILGENYLVKVNSFRLFQDVQASNMIWKYALELTAIANLSETKAIVSLGRGVANDLIQSGVGVVLNKVRKLI